MSQDSGPPDMLEKMGVDDLDVLRCVQAHTTMVARIMSKEVTEELVEATETSIKVRDFVATVSSLLS